jgi:SOS-response transcriptional repressor LexA
MESTEHVPDEREQLLEKFSLRLRSSREAMHPVVTQRDVANRLGVSFSAVNLWEQGRNFPTPNLLVELSKWFSVSVDWLLGLDESGPRKLTVTAPGALRINTVPVVSSLALNRWTWDIALDAVQTRNAYPEGTAAAIVVASESLETVVKNGDYAVISKAHNPEPGSIVLAAIGRASEPVLRKYVREGGEELLVADDTRYPTKRLEEGVRIIGRLVETIRRTIV